MNNDFKLKELLDTNNEQEIKYIVDFENVNDTLKDIFPEPISPQQMIQIIWKYIIDKKLLKQIGVK